MYSRGGKPAEREDTISSAIPKRIIYSVRDKSRQILSNLQHGGTDLDSMYKACRSRSEVVATFIAVLELCSMGSIHISRRDSGYFVEFTGGDLEEILEKITE